jgi:hypothetical protein
LRGDHIGQVFDFADGTVGDQRVQAFPALVGGKIQRAGLFRLRRAQVKSW